MDKLNILLYFISALFRKMPIIFRGKHKLMFMWLVLLFSLGIGDSKLKGMSNCGPSRVNEWRLHRLLSAVYWSIHAMIVWLSDEVITNSPKPEDECVYLIVDGSDKDKRSKKNPYAPKDKIR